MVVENCIKEPTGCACRPLRGIVDFHDLETTNLE
jgi:hypothetical protein